MSAEIANSEQQDAWADEGIFWVAQEELYNAMLEPLGQRAMDVLQPSVGERVIDVGCGCGDTTLALGDRVGPTGSAVGIDISTPMLRRATERAGDIGHVDFVEGDAQTHTLDAGAFDAVFSRFGVMFFEDPAAAFANMVRALRPGGRATFLVWQGLDRNEWMLVPGAALVSVGIELPIGGDPRDPGPFQLADDEWAVSLLRDAGLSEVTCDPLEMPMRIGGGLDPDGAVAFFRDGGMGRAILDGVDDDLVKRAVGAARDAVEPFDTDDGVTLGSAMWILSGRKPT